MLQGFNALKRAFDIVLSFLALILLLPVFLAIAILITIFMPGPVFFVQERVGQNGKKFKIAKFRTMAATENFSAEQTRSLEKSGNDPRITSVGRFLRKSGIDELPQLINIFLGDMSFVGPRPFYQPRYEFNPKLKMRLSAKPGLTCLAVLNGGTMLSEEDTLKFDLEYINSGNFFLDIKIIFFTAILYLSKLWKKDSIAGSRPQ